MGPEGPQGAVGPQGPQGPAGKDGKDGRDGKQGKQGVKGPHGPAGKDGRDGTDGREVELKSENKIVYWKYVDETEWKILIDFSKKSEKDRFKEILDKSKPEESSNFMTFGAGPIIGRDGMPGPPGPAVEMQVNSENVLQYRVVGDTEWIDLIDLDSITPEVPPGEGITIAKNGLELGSGINKLDFLSDGEIVVAGSVATITLGEDMKYTVLLDFVDDYIYKGEAVPGSAGTDEASSIWRISRTFIDPITDDIDILWADGVITFDKIWENHLTYSYS